MTTILRDPLAPLQKGMFDTLSGNTELAALGVTVHDRVNQTTMPYIVIGEDRSVPDDTECVSMTEVFSTVRVYSDAVGKVEAKEIAGIVRWALDKDHGFDVERFKLLSGVCTEVDVTTHSDGLTTQAILNFDYILIPLAEGGTGVITFEGMTITSDATLANVADAGFTFEDMTLAAIGVLSIQGDGVYFADMDVVGLAGFATQGDGFVTFAPMTVIGATQTTVTGNATITLDAMTMVGSGQLVIQGSVDTWFDDMTLIGAGMLSTDGDLNTTFEDMGLFGQARLIIRGDSGANLADMTIIGSGSLDLIGNSNFTFEDMGLTASSGSLKVGDANFTFEDMSLIGDAGLIISGDLTETFEEMTLVGQADMPLTGSATISLSDMALFGQARLQIQGDGAFLADMTITADASLAITGDATMAFAGMTTTTDADLVIQGGLVSTLADMGLTGAGTLSSGSSNEPETDALIARMSVAPSSARETNINDLIAGLKTDGLWSLLDVLQVYAAHTQQASLLDWKNNTDATLTSGTFVADQGFDVSSAGLNSNFNPGSDGVQLTNSVGHIGLWCNNPPNGNVMISNSSEAVELYHLGDGSVYWFFGGGIGLTSSSSGLGNGHFLSSVTGGTLRGYHNGSDAGNTASASNLHSSQSDLLIGFSGYTLRPRVFHSGAGLNATQSLNLYNRINTYLTAIAAE